MKYLLWAITAVAILRWLYWSARQRIGHETAMSLGSFLGVTLWFEVLTGLLPYEYNLLWKGIWLKALGWGMLWLGAVVAVISILTLRLKGKPASGWEHTTQLIEGGIYRWIRHPFYLSALLVVTGTLLLRPAVVTLALWVSSTACFVLAAWYEDRFNQEKFGVHYRRYQRRSKLLIPFLF